MLNQYEKQLAHDRLADKFDAEMNQYDLERRLAILIDEFLAPVQLQGRLILDAGCGTGEGSKRLAATGANVISYDLGRQLLQLTRGKCNCKVVQGDIVHLPFASNTFDVVFSSEVIEHITNPLDALPEFVRVMKPGGYLSLSTPNHLWQFPVRLASLLRIRPYDGLENFVSPREIQKSLSALEGNRIRHTGLHILPFQFTFLHPFLRYMDRYGDNLRPIMINQAVLFQKAK